MGDEQLVEAIAKAFCEAEAAFPIGYFPNGSPMRAGGVWDEYMPQQHEEWRRLAGVVLPFIQAEREACAKVAREVTERKPSTTGYDIIDAIRSRTMGVDR